MSPCHNHHCECAPGRCTHPGFFDDRRGDDRISATLQELSTRISKTVSILESWHLGYQVGVIKEHVVFGGEKERVDRLVTQTEQILREWRR